MAQRNGDGVVYHRSDCGEDYVRWYGLGGDGKGQPCDRWLTFCPDWVYKMVHYFDWNFRAEDLALYNKSLYNAYDDMVAKGGKLPLNGVVVDWNGQPTYVGIDPNYAGPYLAAREVFRAEVFAINGGQDTSNMPDFREVSVDMSGTKAWV